MTDRLRRAAALLAGFALLVIASLLLAGAAGAVVIDSGDGSGNIDPPHDLPWWSHIDERLGGTTIIYLGNGWVLTARHVGMGSLLFGGERYEPDPETAVEFGAPDRPADLVVFRLTEDKPWPDLAFMPIAETAPERGEEVMMIGNGRNRGERLRSVVDGVRTGVGWTWGPGSKMRWGTNRVDLVDQVIEHAETATHAFATRFESIFMGEVTDHEAQAASGDSGGPVFKRLDPGDPQSAWVLAGVMFTVRHPFGGPEEASLYGDFTYVADLSVYREELIAVVRPACANEVDDDGDGHVDHPADPDCQSPFGDGEGDHPAYADQPALRQIQLASIAVVGLVGLALLARALAPRR